MKYGLLVYIDTINLGDDIQSYAARRFLPRVDYIVDRERLDTFTTGTDGPVSVIMNAWYMHKKFNWPPAQVINPFFISVHVTQNNSYEIYGIGDRFLDGLGGDYLRHYAPIGARDESTLLLLRRKGIESYLSGCLTLTLDLPPIETKTDKVLLVDVHPKRVKLLKKRYPQIDWAETTHIFDSKMHCKLSLDERFTQVENQLRLYQGAKCVVTERLHCALPCLALGTPVLLIARIDALDRMNSFLRLLHTTTPKELEKGDTLYNFNKPPANPDTYLEIRRNLEAQCRDFIERCERGEIPEPFCYQKEDLRHWQEMLIQGINTKRHKSISSRLASSFQRVLRVFHG